MHGQRLLSRPDNFMPKAGSVMMSNEAVKLECSRKWNVNKLTKLRMDMSIKIILRITSLISLLLVSNVSQAAIVTWTFTGTIIGLGLGDADPAPGINMGDAVAGTVIYDTNTPATDLGWATGYDLSSTGGLLTIEVSGLTFSSTIAGSELYAQVYNDRTPSYGDVVLIENINSVQDDVFSIQVVDEISPFDLLADESLPTYLDFSKAEELIPDGYGGNYGFIQTQGYFETEPFQTAHFSIDSLTTSVVPVPTAIWLFGSGLIGLAGVARMKET